MDTAVRIIVMTLLILIMVAARMAMQTETKNVYVRCIDCAKWNGKDCDLDEYCGGFSGDDYMPINEMPFYEDKDERKTKKEKNKANPQRIRQS